MEDEYKNLINELESNYIDLCIKSHKYRKDEKTHEELEILLNTEYTEFLELTMKLSRRFADILKIINKILGLDISVLVNPENGSIFMTSTNEYFEITENYSNIIERFFKMEITVMKTESILVMYADDLLYESPTLISMLDMDDDSLKLKFI